MKDNPFGEMFEFFIEIGVGIGLVVSVLCNNNIGNEDFARISNKQFSCTQFNQEQRQFGRDLKAIAETPEEKREQTMMRVWRMNPEDVKKVKTAFDTEGFGAMRVITSILGKKYPNMLYIVQYPMQLLENLNKK